MSPQVIEAGLVLVLISAALFAIRLVWKLISGAVSLVVKLAALLVISYGVVISSKDGLTLEALEGHASKAQIQITALADWAQKRLVSWIAQSVLEGDQQNTHVPPVAQEPNQPS